MESDWEVEIGPGAPVIDAVWPGSIDLQSQPHRVHEIEEASRLPALADALLQLNRPHPPHDRAVVDVPIPHFRTTKCDLWEPEAWDDPDEPDAKNESSARIACYLDLLPRHTVLFSDWKQAEACAKAVAHQLQAVPIPGSRADLIVRSATSPESDGFGITAYLAAQAHDAESAAASLSSALTALVQALNATSPA